MIATVHTTDGRVYEGEVFLEGIWVRIEPEGSSRKLVFPATKIENMVVKEW
jgi:hypothetical protein